MTTLGGVFFLIYAFYSMFLSLGASRERLSDREWQAAVLQHMYQAALVVIAVGATKGLLWEIASATRERLLDRVILLVPPDADENLRMRWAATAATVRAVGGPAIDLEGDPASLFTAQISANGIRWITVGDRRDEYTYMKAVQAALASLSMRTWRYFIHWASVLLIYRLEAFQGGARS